MKTIYFIRHGLSELNTQGKIAGHTETPLTKTGRKQARAAGKKAKNLGIDHIVTSPLSRAYDTAVLMAKEIGYPKDKIEVNPLFIERNFGAMETQPYKPDINFDGIADAEATDVLLARAQQAVHYLKTLPYNKILVVSHGSTGRALRHHIVSGQPFNAPIKYANAELVEWPVL